MRRSNNGSRFMEEACEPLTPSEVNDMQTANRSQMRSMLGRSMEGREQPNEVTFAAADKQSLTTLGEAAPKDELSPGVVNLAFCLIFFMNLIINIDHGVMPAGAIIIKEYLGVSNTEYGLLGSIVFAGLVLGSMAASFFFNTVNTKIVLASILCLNAVSQVCFTITQEYQWLLMCRFMTGFFQVFVSIYWPVWTDRFAPNEKRKATWMSAFLVASPIGVLFGYVLTTQLIINYSWQYAFYVQAVAVGPAVLFLAIIPQKYLSLRKVKRKPINSGTHIQQNDDSISERPQMSVRDQMRNGENSRTLGQSYDTNQLDAMFESEADFGESEAGLDLGMTATTPTMDQLQNLEDESTLHRIKSVLKNAQFVLLALSISSLYFVVTGLQYWVSAYLMISLEIDHEEVYWYYSFVCLSAPISGVIVGGIMFSCIGGYSSPKAYALACLLGFFAVVSCLPVPFCNYKYMVYFLLWCVFFFGATIIAPLVSFMLASVEAERRTTANSIATLAYNLFGYLPAPFVYGLFSDIFPTDVQSSHRVAIGVILYWSIIAMAMMMFAMILFLKEEGVKHNKTMRELLSRQRQSKSNDTDGSSDSQRMVEQILRGNPPQGDTGAAGCDDDFGAEMLIQKRQDLESFQRKSMSHDSRRVNLSFSKNSSNRSGRLDDRNSSFLNAAAANNAINNDSQELLFPAFHSTDEEEIKREENF